MKPLVSSAPVSALKGAPRLPGDKSISHRALMLGAIAVGETVVHGLLEGEDVLHTAAALRALGVEIERDEGGDWHVHGVGVGGLGEPAQVLDMGNAGTATRLLMGLVASHPFTSFFTGDASLSGRPVRVQEPLERIGARVIARSGGRLPLAVIGTAAPLPITYRVPVPSAQVKSAVLLAGLNAPGITTVIEAQPTRDHSERMLRFFGATVETLDREDGARTILLTGQPELRPQRLTVPADISSAAFLLVAALIVPGSSLTLAGIGINPLRAGLLTTLEEMGAALRIERRREEAGEPVADLVIESGRPLKGVQVPAARAPSMIDEYPILAVAAAAAEGRSRFDGLGELRVKESDRLAAIAAGLEANGVRATIEGDSLIVEGTGAPVPGGGTVATHMDHRIAMAFLVLGLAAKQPVTVDDGAMIDTSFPGFAELMNGLGARIAEVPPR